jgi:hypothetical protein
MLFGPLVRVGINKPLRLTLRKKLKVFKKWWKRECFYVEGKEEWEAQEHYVMCDGDY